MKILTFNELHWYKIIPIPDAYLRENNQKYIIVDSISLLTRYQMDPLDNNLGVSTSYDNSIEIIEFGPYLS